MVEFLSPLGWLVALAALVPVVAALIRGRWDRALRRSLSLPAPSLAGRLAPVGLSALAVLLLAAATARPALRTSGSRGVRTDAQVFFVLDTSRSMLARLPHGRTRYARAVAAAATLRARLAGVPAGLASLTDRPLPHLFPTADERLFSSVLHESIGIERPPPASGNQVLGVVTSFDSLAQVAGHGYFSPVARRRLLILLTDGESNRFAPAALAAALRRRHVGLLVVRFWDARERVYQPGGQTERYRPEPGSLRPLEALSAALGEPVFGEHALARVARAARARLGTGPTRAVAAPSRIELAPYLALAAVLPVALVLRRRDP